MQITNFRIFLQLLLSFCSLSVFAQQPMVKVKVGNQLQFAKDIIFSDMRRAARTIDTVISVAKREKLYLEEATAYNLKGIIYNSLGKIDSSLLYFQKSEELGIKIGDDLTVAKAKHNKNMPLSKMGKYAQALETCLEAIKYYEATNKKSYIASCYGDIGNILIRQKNTKDAVGYLKKALAIADEINEPALKINFYNSLAVAYDDLGEEKSAREIYITALALAEKLNNLQSQMTININLGLISWALDKTDDKSFEYYLKAEKLAKKYGDEPRLAYIYQNLSRNYFHRKDYQNALVFALNAKSIMLKTKDLYSLEKIYSSLAEIYKMLHKPEESYDSFLKKDSVAAILYNKESTATINELKEKYETEKKQQQIQILNSENKIQGLALSKKQLELLNKSLENDKNIFRIGAQELLLQKNKIILNKKQVETKAKAQQIKLLASQNEVQKLELLKRNIWLGVVIGLLLVMVLIGYLFYNRYKLKQEAKLNAEILAQQDLATKAVLNAEENERKRISGELHDGLGQMFSAVKMNLSALTDGLNFKDEHAKEMFGKTMNLVDESCKEVRVISHQMAPNVLLKSGLATAIRDFINKIDSRRLKINLETVGLQERLDQNIETVLYRVIQETVNNVIKHSGANVLDIQLNRDHEGINAMIEDNGKGFDASQIEKFEGIGLKNIRTRVNYLKGTVDFSSQPQQGTLIAIFIPFDTSISS